MRIVRVVLFIVLCFTMTCAWADIGPRPSKRTFVIKPHAKVSMENANVQVNIRRGLAQRGEREAQLIAEVSGEFDMKCSAVAEEDKNIDLVFPLYYSDEGDPPASRNFSAGIDGKPAEDVKAATWLLTDENNRLRTQDGYTWRLLGLKSGQTRRLTVQYRLILPQDHGKAPFIYFLRTGASWDGPIGKEVVEVTAEKGLHMEVLTPVALEPEQKTDSSLRWTITNAKPAEDIRLDIVLDAKP